MGGLRMGGFFWVLLLGIACFGCASTNDNKQADATPKALSDTSGTRPSPSANTPALSRADFNRLAVMMDLPLFWSQDSNEPGMLNPQELLMLGVGFDRRQYLNEKGQFNENFRRIAATMVEHRRLEAVAAELDQGRPTLVHTSFAKAPETDRQVVRHITRAARLIEELHAIQRGSLHLRRGVRSTDTLGQALFRRNQGPWCVAPRTEADPFCNALPSFPAERSGLYPLELQQREDFCAVLSADPKAKQLLDPFSVVRKDPKGDGFVAIPYNVAYKDRMDQIAAELRACATVISDPSEQAFVAYLKAAAAAFVDNRWEPADEAWAAMNATNSKWYLRIGPDEVYFEPCNRKAGFHVSFARIDPDSIYWQDKLTPLRDEMETQLATLIGDAYKARQVSVHMPDFIEIVLNAGDARSPLGATIGQSLPNWGKVAEEGRGRTVVMSNLYTDPDSRKIARHKAEALLSPESLKVYTENKRLSLLDIVLHEATHNFGPHSDYKIDGKRPGDVFGGTTATVLEELKAQTGALYYVEMLRNKGVLTDEQAHQVWLHSILWCFGHISRGMQTPEGRPKPYSQVAGLHVAFLEQQGALVWQADQLAANGQDQGRFHVQFDKFAPAVEKLMQRVGRIKAGGDSEGARTLIDAYVKGEHAKRMHQKTVAERVLRHPKASFVYSVTY